MLVSDIIAWFQRVLVALILREPNECVPFISVEIIIELLLL